MTKKEFLDTLGGRLAQTISREKVTEHIQYYDSYLAEKMSQGLSEEEAVAQLGDPLLIARTIMDTSEDGGGHKVIYEEVPGRENEWSVEKEGDSKNRNLHQISVHTRGGCLLAAVIFIVVLVLVLWLVGSVVSILLPVLIPALVVVLVIAYFKQN